MEILNVLIPMYSGDRDEFGREGVPPLPLSFDRVNAGQAPRSNAALFTLPYEILGLILGSMSSESLPALALVNRDCLQWARSRQFCSVQLDHSYASSSLVHRLLTETKERVEAEGMISPSIGRCIRRIKVATNPAWVSHRLGVDLTEEFQELPEEKRRERIVDASQEFLVGYISVIQAALNIVTMPHLELLDWEDKIPLPHSFFEHLAMSSIKHLKLYRVKVQEELFLELPETSKDSQWSLQTLHMKIYTAMEKLGKLSMSPLSTSILRLCAPTLRDLKIEDIHGEDPLTFVDQRSTPAPRFPSLRHLTVGNDVLFKDASVLDALVQDNLRTLNVGIDRSSITKEFFQQRGRISALETFVWESFHLPADHPLDFLRANSQITKLALPHPSPSTLLGVRLLPLLSDSFSKLTSLSLVWGGWSISELSLEMIASLRTLKQLHLSSGNQHGWRHDWPIDHQVMRKHLSKLSLLKKLAFSRDTHINGERGLYYVDHVLLAEDMPENPDDSDTVWERKHSERILEEAKLYVEMMANVEWLYFGQIPMQVVGAQETGYRVPEPLSPERDSCWTLLRSMFGGNTR